MLSLSSKRIVVFLIPISSSTVLSMISICADEDKAIRKRPARFDGRNHQQRNGKVQRRPVFRKKMRHPPT
jgi:hypothetical protein